MPDDNDRATRREQTVTALRSHGRSTGAVGARTRPEHDTRVATSSATRPPIELLRRWLESVGAGDGHGLRDRDDESSEPLYSPARLERWFAAASASGRDATRADAPDADALADHAEVVRTRQQEGIELDTLLAEYDRLEDLLLEHADAHHGSLRECIRKLRTHATRSWFEAAEAEREHCRRVLAQWSRLIRHDIKTPLQAASLNLEILQMDLEDHGHDASGVEVIASSLEQAIEMLRDHESLE